MIFTTVFAGEAVEIQKKTGGNKNIIFFDFDLFDLGIAGAMGEEMAEDEKNIKKMKNILVIRISEKMIIQSDNT